MQSFDRWQGWWEQAGYGRQPMRDLVLRFDDGAISGEGWDCVGRFTFVGRMDARGHVVLSKQYLGAHAVLYTGNYDGEGTIFGRWSIGDWVSGDFALAPLGPADRR